MRTDRTATAEDIEEYSRRLQIALEDRGQQALIQYLQGDELEPKKETFTRCASDFKAARELAGISVFDESRELFCRGRALIFDKQFEPGERALLESIHLDSKRSYSYNALGIAYLEQATKTPAYYDRARAAFETAIRYAPYWTYPWHNMALLYTETGNYEEAIRSYRHAMDIDPSYSYLPYNLGLLYQRLNRKADARQSYELAFRKADEARRYGYLDSADGTRPQESMAHNAMGALAADRGRWGQAQKLYREALQDDAKNLDARHNLALLLTRGKKPTPAQRMEAEDLWNTVLGQDRDNIPARLARARYEVRESELNTAITDYQELIRRYPDLQPARREVVDALVANHEPAEAFATLKGIRNPTAIDIRAYHRIAAEAVSQNDEVTRSAASDASQKLARELSHVP
jgi:tetratricopeptide (TPR) repeat protein